MKFGLFSHVPWPEEISPSQVVDNITEEFVVGEELGFDSGWLAEHHFSRSDRVCVADGCWQHRGPHEELRLGTPGISHRAHPVKAGGGHAPPASDLLSGGALLTQAVRSHRL